MVPFSSQLCICLFGPPGSGKSTLAKQLATQFGFVHVQAGQLLRKLVANANDSLAASARAILESGTPIPANMLVPLLTTHLGTALTGPVVFDGLPRDTVQLSLLPMLLAGLGFSRPTCCGVVFEASVHVCRSRLVNRTECLECGLVASTLMDTCSNCGAAATRRLDDDLTAAIDRRFQWYQDHVTPTVREFASLYPPLVIYACSPQHEVLHRVREWLAVQSASSIP